MLDRISERLEEGIMAFLLAAMTLLTFTQVVLRYVFNSGFTWALEASTYLFGWMVLLGISYGVRKGAHIGVDVLVQQLSRPARRVVGVIATLLCLAYAVLLLIGSYTYVDTMHTLGVEAEDLPIERWILLLALPIGFILLLIRLVQVTWRIIRGAQDGFRLADEAREAIDQFHNDGQPGQRPAP